MAICPPINKPACCSFSLFCSHFPLFHILTIFSFTPPTCWSLGRYVFIIQSVSWLSFHHSGSERRRSVWQHLGANIKSLSLVVSIDLRKRKKNVLGVQGMGIVVFVSYGRGVARIWWQHSETETTFRRNSANIPGHSIEVPKLRTTRQ